MIKLLLAVLVLSLTACAPAKDQPVVEVEKTLNGSWSGESAQIMFIVTTTAGVFGTVTSGDVHFIGSQSTCRYAVQMTDGRIIIESQVVTRGPGVSCDFFTQATDYSLSGDILIITSALGTRAFNRGGIQ